MVRALPDGRTPRALTLRSARLSDTAEPDAAPSANQLALGQQRCGVASQHAEVLVGRYRHLNHRPGRLGERQTRLTSGSRQGSQDYVAPRLSAYVNTDDG
jgi:hypothetical protein